MRNYRIQAYAYGHSQFQPGIAKGNKSDEYRNELSVASVHTIVFNAHSSVANTTSMNLSLASLSKRYAAIFYELLLLLAICFVADYLFISLTHNAQSPTMTLILRLYLLLIMGCYFVWMWTRGQSLAMKTWRIRLVTQQGENLSIGIACLRFLLATALFGISQIWAFFDREHQFLHDRLLGTRLIQMNHPQAPDDKTQ